MKKFLTILAVAGLMTACNNAEDDTTTEDSARMADSIGRMNTPTPAVDSPAMKVDSPAVKMDSPAVKK
jgi:hypothetical protein